VELKDELSSTAIQITCYNRNGEEVKRVTSSDDGTVEDPEGGDDNGGSTNTGENTGGNSGGGDNGGSGGFDTGS
ncbi:MAG: DNA-binding protein, partial [Bacteroidaceae bacterium]|nr:DNA-binding protein [Bacteroidaceae bacterium]